MKKFLALLILLALPAFGDVTITNTYTDGQAARITRAMNRVNKATCDGATQVDIYSDVATFLNREAVRLVKEEYGKKNDIEDAAAFVANPSAATTAQKNAWCSVNNLPNGCLP